MYLIVGGLVLMFAIIVGTGLTIQRFKRDAIASGRASLEANVLLLARHFDQQLEDFSVLQKSIIPALEDRGLSSPEAFEREVATFAVHQTLRMKAVGWATVAGVNIFDANGTLINSSASWPVPDVNISDRSYFRHLKDDPTILSEIEVVPGRFSGTKVIVFSRRISGQNGEFLGIATRAIGPQALEDFLASAELSAEDSIAIHHVNGQMLARYPHAENLIGKNFKGGSAEQMAVFQKPFVSARLISPVDGKERLVASRRLTFEPLVIVATKTLDSTLTTWRSQTKSFMLTAALSMLLIVAILYLIFRQMMQQIRVEKQRLKTAVNNLTNGLLLFDSSERLIVCNDRYISMYGLSSDVAKPGCKFRDLVKHRQESGSFVGDIDAYCSEILQHVGHFHSSIVESSDGRLIEIRNIPVSTGGWLATHEDITERLKAERRISHLAHYDALTGLANRVQMRAQIEKWISEFEQGRKFSILYIDIDEFKGVNDTLGHNVGDELLKQIGLRLESCVGPRDMVARLGGDEFAVLKEDVDDTSSLGDLADEILRVLRAPIVCSGHDISIDASIGIVMMPDHGENLEDLLKNADLAMYAAKADGRRTYRFFSPALDASAKKKRQMERDLRQAVTEDQFEIHYQPLVSLADGAITGCEALLRWRHPVHGMISPAEFIPIAEETGLINEIGDWVLQRACSDAASWPAEIAVAVNVSPVQFKSKTLPIRVAMALEKSGLSPRRLELEITEAVLIRDDEALTFLHQLRNLGLKIALDDFGTGYSSLSYLRRFPFDKIKIDRSFVNDIGVSEESSAIIRAVVDMAAACRMVTTAEGVETEVQRKILRDLGCCQMQGYLFSAPVPVSMLDGVLSGKLRPASCVA